MGRARHRWYGPAVTLRAARQSLLDRGDLQGDAFCHAYSAAADEWLSDLFDRATDGNAGSMALIAVGGYGRSELCPYSDLDVVLIHRGRRDITATANRIWYPVWDEGIALDYSVRRPSDVLEMAGKDLKVALGLLDARVVCGDAKVAEPVLDGAARRWVRQKPPWLGVLATLVAERHAVFGDVGFLLEPDLKESHGGLRDVAVLRSLMRAVPALDDYIDAVATDDARSVLIAARVELHRRAGRQLDRLVLQEQDAVAAQLGEPSSDAFMQTIATAGRTIAWECDDAWRRRSVAVGAPDGSRRRRSDRRASSDADDGPVQVPEEPGIAIGEEEVVLAATADAEGDASLGLRLAAVSAETELPIARDALNLLARKAPVPEQPWPSSLRATLVRVLASGRPAIAAIEALDRRQLFDRYLPEWAWVRNKPQRNPYHRFTVDRHLLEACANAAALADRVDRPDLLLIGTLLHDLGKGFPGDHTEAGMVVAAEVAERMGFEPDDRAILVSLVEHHLLLPDVATRRDLTDPATAERVAEAVGDRCTLDLLAAMVEADSLATGPSAWSAWKAGLIAELVERTSRLLAGEPHLPPVPRLTDDVRFIMDDVRARGVPALAIEEPLVTVVAPDRARLLSDVTAVLALHGLNVRAADITGEDGVAVEIFTAEPEHGRWPAVARLSDDLVAVSDGRLAVEERLAERTRTYRTHRPAAPDLVSTQVTVDNNASEVATVVEVRAEDVVGQLHRITRAFVDRGLDVTSAKVSTFGSAVVDAFYVRGADGGKVTDSAAIQALERALAARIAEAGDGSEASAETTGRGRSSG
jgi:[protein-PII] uridylyltransferase